MIRITDLNKYFNRGKQNEIHVINNTSLEFPETGLVAITGPSGCGKTTLLNVIGGLDKFSKGTIDFDGTVVKHYKPLEWDILRNKYIGYIFQNYNLLTDKTVYENVEISLNMAGLYDKDLVQERIDYVLESVGMYNYRRRNVQALSGGQQQRVAIARAIAKSPKVVLADEPTGNLDVNNTFEVMSIIKKISQTCLVILVSHERELVEFYADRVIEIKDGAVVNDYENQGNRTLEHVDTRNIYLRDLEKESVDSPIGLDFYYDKKIADIPKLKVVYSNNTLYVKADANTKVKYITDETDIRLLDMSYRKPETGDVTKHAFDLHQFGSIVADKARKSFIRFRDTLKAGFAKIFKKRKLINRMFLFAYFVISAMIAYNLATFTDLTGIQDKDFLSTSRNLVAVSLEETMEADDIAEILSETTAESLNYYQQMSRVTFSFNSYYQADIIFNIYAYPVKISQLKNPSLILGAMPVNNRQVAIDRWVADAILERAVIQNFGGKNYSDLIGKMVQSSQNFIEFEIVGIVETNSPVVVLTDSNFHALWDHYLVSSRIIAEGTADGDYSLIDGRAIQNDTEALASSLSGAEINDVIVNYTGHPFTIVGIYQSETTNRLIVSNAKFEAIAVKVIIEESSQWWIDQNVLYFYSEDTESTVEEIEELGFEAEDAYQKAKDQHSEWITAQIARKLRVIIIALAGSLVYLVFMMRSSLLGRVKEVGIYRSIGATKRDVYKIFLSEILAFTTLGSMTGYLAMSTIIVQFQKINPLADSDFYFPFYIFLTGIAGIYLLNMIFGMMPVFSLLRKTPSEIIAKYDI